MTQGTIGTPITPGSGTGISLASPLPATWLSLHRYMRIMGLVSPPHFFGSYNSAVFPLKGTCDVVVPRHGWQKSDVASREEILNEVKLAEDELSEYMGFKLALGFVTDELHRYPKPYETLAVGQWGTGTNGLELSIPAGSGYVLQSGSRSATLVGTASTGGGGLQYTDEDSDGVIETAKVTVSTTQTNACNLKAYVSGMSGSPNWEIRHPRRKYISGGNVVFEFDVWLFINPDLDARLPTVDSYRALDFADTNNLMPSVDIYLESVDNTQASVRFFWEEPSGGDSSALTTQDGVLVVRDYIQGDVIPRPATYDSDSGTWTFTNWVVGRDPDQVRISYYAGNVSEEFLNGISCDPLSEMYAKAIAYMATARLSRSICGCEGIIHYFDRMQVDLAKIESTRSYNVTLKDLDNPFGTRLGEVMAWRLLGKVDRDRQVEGVVI